MLKIPYQLSRAFDRCKVHQLNICQPSQTFWDANWTCKSALTSSCKTLIALAKPPLAYDNCTYQSFELFHKPLRSTVFVEPQTAQDSGTQAVPTKPLTAFTYFCGSLTALTKSLTVFMSLSTQVSCETPTKPITGFTSLCGVLQLHFQNF